MLLLQTKILKISLKVRKKILFFLINHRLSIIGVVYQQASFQSPQPIYYVQNQPQQVFVVPEENVVHSNNL